MHILRCFRRVIVSNAESPVGKYDLDLDEIVPFMAINGTIMVKHIRLSASLLSVLPARAGTITKESQEFTTSVAEVYTTESFVDTHFIVSGFAGYQFDMGEKLTIAPLLGFSYTYRKWSAEDGEDNQQF